MGGRFLAEFELYVMLAVARLGDGAYGAAIRREIQSRTGRGVSVGALYATLGRLGDKGYLTFTVSEPEPVPGGRARKCCALTPAGREALTHSAKSMHTMMKGLDLIPETDR